MNFVVALFLMCCLVFSEEIKPLDFNWDELQLISESPEFSLALENLVPHKSSSSELGLENRIIGGRLANPGQFPQQVLLILDSRYVCGGSLIYPNWVLTVRTRNVSRELSTKFREKGSALLGQQIVGGYLFSR